VTADDERVLLSARAADVIADLIAERSTVATAESITGGRLVAALTAVAGSSAVVRGSVVAYANEVKTSMLGVDPGILAEEGAVSSVVAEQMARGARDRLGATYGVATTGEAGPSSGSGSPVGTVFVAVAGPNGVLSRRLDASGDRARIQQSAVEGALRMLAEVRAAGVLAPDDSTGRADLGNNGD
jgi:nicotinamide-nucleotide amidase